MDIVLDSCVLIDLVQQYTNFSSNKDSFLLEKSNEISDNIAREINKLIQKRRNGYYSGYIVASTFSFVELARKILDFNIKIEKLKAFIDQPPEWVVIEATSPNLLEYLVLIPKVVGKNKKIEWADALVVATALSRQDFILSTLDNRIQRIPILKNKILC